MTTGVRSRSARLASITVMRHVRGGKRTHHDAPAPPDVDCGGGDGRDMGDTRRAAQDAFARFVRGAVDAASDERGWSITEVAARSGVGRSTVFRWLSGDWQHHPELPKVRAFCAALDLPLGAALRALTPLSYDTPAAGGAGGGGALRGRPGPTGRSPHHRRRTRAHSGRLTPPRAPKVVPGQLTGIERIR